VNPYIREWSSTNTGTGYYADDLTNPDFFIEASIATIKSEKILTFIVRTIKPGPGGTVIRGKVKGSEFFEAMWEHFVAMGTTIDVIQGEWSDRVIFNFGKLTANLDAFNRALLIHSTREDAASNGTPTGRYAKKKLYTKVHFAKAEPPSQTGTGPYTDVVVQFRRP